MIAGSIGVELRVDDRDARAIRSSSTWDLAPATAPRSAVPASRVRSRQSAIHGDRLAVGQSGSSLVAIYRRDGAGWTIDGSRCPRGADRPVPVRRRPRPGRARRWSSAPVARSKKTTRAGAVFLFDRDAGGRWYQAARFDLPDGNPIAIGGDLFRFAVAADGDTIIVGAPYTDITSPTIPSGRGLRVPSKEDGWTRRAKLSNPAVQNLGRVVAVSGDVILAGTFLPT